MIWVFDIVMALMLLGVAWRLLFTPDLFKGIVLFIVFGVLMAVTYARLSAPDVALTEAAVGAGITGALLLQTLRRLHGSARTPPCDTMEN